MNETIESQIELLYENLMEKPKNILEIFNEFFGEDKVDMQEFPTLDIFKTTIETLPLWKVIPERFLVKDPNEISHDDYIFINRTINDLEGSEIDKISSLLHYSELTFNGLILVHFPEVRVTNEYNKYIDIKHLFAKVKLDAKGKMIGRFSLNRSEYTPEQFNMNYMHSHISHIPVEDFRKFLIPCTGSGPINVTITNLNMECDFDLWKLFCLELSKFVETESIAGAPYYRLETIRAGNYGIPIKHVLYTGHRHYSSFDLLAAFIKYFITNNKLKFSFSNNSYSLGIPIIDYLRDISNEFIKWYNEEYNKHHFSISLQDLLYRNILIQCVIKDSKIYKVVELTDINRSRQHIGKEICMFKGNSVRLDINYSSIPNSTRNTTHLLNPHIALSILFSILYIINYKYGKTSKQSKEDNRPSEKVLYL